MATPWNPNDPAAVGPEFLAELTRSWTVGSTAGSWTAASQRFRSTAAESSPELQLFSTAVTGEGYLMAEIMEDDGTDTFPLLTDIQLDAIQPDLAFTVFNFENQAGSTVPANLIASIDETGDPSSVADWIGPVTVGRPQGISIQFDAAQISAAVTGRRILGVTVGIRTMPQTAADKSDLYLVRHNDVVSGTPFRTMDRIVNAANSEAWFNLGELYTDDDDASVAAPWTPASLAELANGGADCIRIACSGGDGIKFSRVRMVIATAAENREAVAVFNQDSWELTEDMVGNESGVWSSSVELVEPDLSGGWSKADATTYRISWRRAFTGNLVNSLNVTIPVLSRHDSEGPPAGTFLDDPLLYYTSSIRGPAAAAVPTTVAVAPGVAEFSIVPPTGAAIQPSGIMPFRLLVATVDSADGQPYTQVLPVELTTAESPTEQFITTGAGGDYSAVRCVIGFASNNEPTADLELSIRDSSGFFILATGTVPVDEYRARPDFRGSQVLLETIIDVEVTLAAATQYRLRWASTTSEAAGWLIGVYTARGGDGQSATWPTPATYGGGTDFAFGTAAISGPVTPDCDDVVAFVGLAIDGPEDLAATANALAFDEASDPCGIEEIPYAGLAWSPSSLGAGFSRYVIQRRDSVTDVWQVVAYITEEGVADLTDVEVRLGGIESEWRIRSEGPDGETSLWEELTTPIGIPSAGCGYTFSSNWAPLDSIGYVDIGVERGYDMPGSDEVQVRRFAGRDEFVVFRPLERRSERFQRSLVVRSFTGPAGIVGPEAFRLLRDISEDQSLPYVCVRDEQGNRWFAGVIVTGGTVRQPGDYHRAAIDVVPVVGPSPPTIEG